DHGAGRPASSAPLRMPVPGSCCLHCRKRRCSPIAQPKHGPHQGYAGSNLACVSAYFCHSDGVGVRHRNSRRDHQRNNALNSAHHDPCFDQQFFRQYTGCPYPDDSAGSDVLRSAGAQRGFRPAINDGGSRTAVAGPGQYRHSHLMTTCRIILRISLCLLSGLAFCAADEGPILSAAEYRRQLEQYNADVEQLANNPERAAQVDSNIPSHVSVSVSSHTYTVSYEWLKREL